jgi:uroporphyrinogen-III synthase
MGTLCGRTIALLESRRSREFASLVHELGGVPVSAPAVDEVACYDDFNSFFDGLARRQFSIAVLLNGASTSTLLEEATRRGRLSDVVHTLRGVTIACRGQKPADALHPYSIRPQITTERPHTTHELLRALSTVDVVNRGIVLVHTGHRNRAVVDDLRSRGARLTEVCPYESALPADAEPIAEVVRDAVADRLDAVLFTNRAQCTHLFRIAAEMNQAEGLALCLNRRVVVGAVGPVCADALREAGVIPDVVPIAASMPSLVRAVAAYFETDAKRPPESRESRAPRGLT